MCPPQLAQFHLFQSDAQIVGNHRCPCQHRHVLKHFLAPITKARRLDGHRSQDAANLVDHQCGQCLAFDVICDQDQGLTIFRNKFEQGQQVLECAYLVVTEQQVGVIEFDLHFLGVGDEVR
ncbi:hypothetical protein D9M71_787370 [compost metagenome]